MNKAARPRGTRGPSSIRTRAQIARQQSRIPSPTKQPLSTSTTSINMPRPRPNDDDEDELLLSPSKKRPMSPSFDRGHTSKRVKGADENKHRTLILACPSNVGDAIKTVSDQVKTVSDAPLPLRKPEGGIFPSGVPTTPGAVRHFDFKAMPAPRRPPATPSLIRFPMSLTTIPGSPSKPSDSQPTRLPISRLPRPSSQHFPASPAKQVSAAAAFISSPPPATVAPKGLFGNISMASTEPAQQFNDVVAPLSEKTITTPSEPTSFAPPLVSVPTATRPSILQRAGTLPTTSDRQTTSSSVFSRRAVHNPHQETQSQLSNLSVALEKLAKPRPATSMGFRGPSTNSTAPSSRPTSVKLTKVGDTNVLPRRPSVSVQRPGTSLGFHSASMKLSQAQGDARAGKAKAQPATIGPFDSRRASAASIALSLSLPAQPLKPVVKPPPLSASHPPTRQSLRLSQNRPPSSTQASPSEQAPVKESKPKIATLDVLKDCTVFVDVRTEEGDDAGGLFVDMLRGLGAKVLVRYSASLTHIVFKSGLPTTVAKYSTLPDPKPIIVGIGWVVECVERRQRVDEARFTIAVQDLVVGGSKRRRSFHSRHMRPPITASGDGNEADQSNLSVSSSNGIPSPVKEEVLTPLERARRKNLLFAPRISSPLRRTFSPDDG